MISDGSSDLHERIFMPVKVDECRFDLRRNMWGVLVVQCGLAGQCTRSLFVVDPGTLNGL